MERLRVELAARCLADLGFNDKLLMELLQGIPALRDYAAEVFEFSEGKTETYPTHSPLNSVNKRMKRLADDVQRKKNVSQWHAPLPAEHATVTKFQVACAAYETLFEAVKEWEEILHWTEGKIVARLRRDDE
jgi:hypothetical protein